MEKLAQPGGLAEDGGVQLPEDPLLAGGGEALEEQAVGDVEDLEAVHAVEDEEEGVAGEDGAADAEDAEVGEVGGDGEGEVDVEGAHDLELGEALAAPAELLHYVRRVGDARHRQGFQLRPRPDGVADAVLRDAVPGRHHQPPEMGASGEGGGDC